MLPRAFVVASAAAGGVEDDVLINNPPKDPPKGSRSEDCGVGHDTVGETVSKIGPNGVLSSVFDTLEDQVLVVDDSGSVLAANALWRKFCESSTSFLQMHRLPDGQEAVSFSEEVFQKKVVEGRKLIEGVMAVMNGSIPEFQREYSLHDGLESRRFQLRVNALGWQNAKAVMISHRDITAHYNAEQALNAADALFRRVIEETSDGIFLYDLEGRFIMTNLANATMLGRSVESIQGRLVEEVFNAETAHVIREQNALVLNSGRSFDFELTVQSPLGPRTVLVRKSVYHDGENRAVGIFGIARDITDRKNAEEMLARSERHFRALIENSADCIRLIDANGTIRYASPSTKRVYGFEPVEVIGSNALMWVHPEDRARIARMLGDLNEFPGASVTDQYRSLCKDGRWQWMESTVSNLLHDPAVAAIVVNQRDISERKHAEAALLRFEAIVKSANEAIIGTDDAGRINSWNPAAQHIFGYSSHEVLGKKEHLLIPPDRMDEHDRLVGLVVRGKAVNDFETVRLAKDGLRIPVSLTLSPIRDREQAVTGYCAVVHDITERRRLEREILEIADYEKRRLGNDLHDDLCQLLVGIALQGNTLHEELCRNGVEQAADARRINELALAAVERARGIARGLSRLNLRDTGLMAELQALAAETESLFRIPCAFECNAPVTLENATEANHFYRIIQEALHNAVKHSKAASVEIVLEKREDAIVATVRDHGIGMDAGKCVAPGDSLEGRSGGLGMHTMHYRARIIGASLELRPNPTGGTLVICTMPVRGK